MDVLDALREQRTCRRVNIYSFRRTSLTIGYRLHLGNPAASAFLHHWVDHAKRSSGLQGHYTSGPPRALYHTVSKGTAP